MSKLVAREYEIVDADRPPDMVIRIEWRGDDAWCVSLRGDVLTKDGNWQHEPLPSSRTTAFKAWTRWPTVSAAHQAYDKFVSDYGEFMCL